MKAVQWSVEPIGTVHKHQDSDLNLRFIFSKPENHPIPECVMCEEKLSNESMVPSILKRHFNTKCKHLSVKDKNYFSQMLSSKEKKVVKLRGSTFRIIYFNRNPCSLKSAKATAKN